MLNVRGTSICYVFEHVCVCIIIIFDLFSLISLDLLYVIYTLILNGNKTEGIINKLKSILGLGTTRPFICNKPMQGNNKACTCTCMKAI